MDKANVSQIVMDVLQKSSSKTLVLLEDIINGGASFYQIKGLYPKEEVHIYCEKKIENLIETKKYGTVVTQEDIRFTFDNYERIILLSPSLKLLSKVKNFIVNDFLTEILYEGLTDEKAIHMSEIEDNLAISMLPERLQKYAVNVVNEVNEIGIQFICQKENTHVLSNNIITEQMIKSFDELDLVVVNKQAVITPLALDMIKAKRIKLRRL